MSILLYPENPYTRRYNPDTKSYEVRFPVELGNNLQPFSTTVLRVTTNEDVKWTPDTKISSAILRFKAHGRNDAAFITPVSMEGRVFINDVLVTTVGWYVTPGCEIRESYIEVLQHLLNGGNKFLLELAISPHLLWCGLDSIHCTLEIDYTGDPPVIKPSPQWWEAYLKYGIISVIGIGAVFTGIKLWETAKRKG